jgi:hypothetical protein
MLPAPLRGAFTLFVLLIHHADVLCMPCIVAQSALLAQIL